MASEPETQDSPDQEKPPRFPLRERFVWLWHPHFWLTLLLVVIVLVVLLLRQAK